MDRLWTPWRFHYLRSARENSVCVLCRLPAEQKDRENLILTRHHHNYIVLNRFPYTTGHLMIVSCRHIASLVEATPEELQEMTSLVPRCEQVLRKTYTPDGFNVGFNIGKCAGAAVADHLHLHVVPRWEGDANTISVIGETRVIPEDLHTSYQKLQPLFSPSQGAD